MHPYVKKGLAASCRYPHGLGRKSFAQAAIAVAHIDCNAIVIRIFSRSAIDSRLLLGYSQKLTVSFFIVVFQENNPCGSLNLHFDSLLDSQASLV